ncbi:MAG: hypothetical protein SGPRY_014185, partial [Prymnesium sp.]
IALGQHLLRQFGESGIPEEHPYADWLKIYAPKMFSEHIGERVDHVIDARVDHVIGISE